MNKPIINKFINQFKTKHPHDRIEIIGILGFGSGFSRKCLSPNSDLDLYIVIKNFGKRYRGVMKVNNREVDYFVYPREQLKADWAKIRNKINTKRTIAYMLKDGKVILDKNHALKKLQVEAKKFLRDEIRNSAISPNLLVIYKYFVSDYLKDIDDSLLSKDIFAWQYNFSSLLNFLVEMFCQFHKIPLVKPKFQKNETIKKDKKFVKLYEAVAAALSPIEKSERLKELAQYCLMTFGGKLPQEWELERPIEL